MRTFSGPAGGSGLLRDQRQPDGERAPGARRALERELAPVRDDDRPRDREPEPGPVGDFLAPGLETHERLKDALDVDGRDADPGVAHGDGGPVTLAAERD